MGIGKSIRDARIKNNLTQAELAKKLEVTNTTVSNYENGVSSPDYPMLLKLVRIFGTSIFGFSNGCSVAVQSFDKTTEIGLFPSLERKFSAEETIPLFPSEKTHGRKCYAVTSKEKPHDGSFVVAKSNGENKVFELRSFDDKYVLLPKNKEKNPQNISLPQIPETLKTVKCIIHFFD